MGIIYTAIFGGKDEYVKPTCVEHPLFFSEENDPIDIHRSWREPVMSAKAYKVVPHQIGLKRFHERSSLWVDGSVVVASQLSLLRLIEKYLGDSEIVFFRHQRRNTVKEEAERCLDAKLDDPYRIQWQMRRMQSIGLPERLSMGGIILRRHTPAVAAFGERWWWEILRGSTRDQLSLDFALDQSGVKWSYFDETERSLFTVRKHVR